MFKFLHAADIHLDSPLRGLDRYEGCPGEEVRGATRRALDNLVRLAIGEGVAFVLIAGDVYDGDWKDHDTGLWFVRQMARLREEGIPVFLIRGNHDAQNQMTGELRLPKNVTSLDVNKPQTCRLDRVPVAIHGQGFASQWVREDIAANYPAADPGCFNVGLLHTGFEAQDGYYAPCTVESLRAKEYGYWALGHIHKRADLGEPDRPIAFPGNVQGRNIREGGPKGCLLVTVEGGRRASSEFRPLDVLRWETCPLDASAAAQVDDVAELFEEALPGLIAGADGRLLALRVELVGEAPAHDLLVARSDRIAHELRKSAVDYGSGRVWVEKLKVKTRPPRSARDGLADGPFGEIDRLLAELRGDDRRLEEFAARELNDLRKKLPAYLGDLDADDRLDLGSPAWLRGVLDEVRPTLFDRFEASRVGR